MTGTGVVTRDSKNEAKLELPVRQGEVLFFLNSTEHPPTGKWLAKNARGQSTYSELTHEDFYEAVET